MIHPKDCQCDTCIEVRAFGYEPPKYIPSRYPETYWAYLAAGFTIGTPGAVIPVEKYDFEKLTHHEYWTDIPPETYWTIVAQPAVIFKPKSLFIQCADEYTNLWVQQVTVGVVTIEVGGQKMPAACFPVKKDAPEFDFPTCSPAQRICVRLENRSPRVAMVKVWFRGLAAR